MIPYAPNGQYAGGWHDFPVGVSSISVPWSEELFEDVRQAPHISLHASGQVHAHAGGAKTGPVQVTPLREWRGQHAMSLTIDQFAGLARLSGAVRTSSHRPDWVFALQDGRPESGSMLFYLNGEEPTFGGDCSMSFSLSRPGSRRPLHVGVQLQPREPFGDSPTVVALAGWDVNAGDTNHVGSMLYVMGT
jgi:hypothetical protein